MNRWRMLFVCLIALGASAPGAEDDANEAREAREKVAWLQDQAAGLPGQTEWSGLFAKADLKLAQEAAKKEIVHWEQIARLYEQRQGAEARKLREQERALARATNAWRSRLEVRHWQNQVAPSESWYNGTRAGCPAGAIATLDALARARRKAAEAWDALAEAMLPGADEAKLEQLKDRALGLAGEVETAQLDFEWTLRRERSNNDRKDVTSDEIRRLNDQIIEVQRKRVQLRREEAAREAETRKLEQQRERLEDELEKAVNDERRRREEQKKAK